MADLQVRALTVLLLSCFSLIKFTVYSLQDTEGGRFARFYGRSEETGEIRWNELRVPCRTLTNILCPP
jgi:hypothetical protein